MKIGLIGCGGIAPVHIQAYQNLKDVKVVSLCDLNLDKAKNLAVKYKIGSTYDNYWDMFKKEELDLVDICTPVSTHAKIVCDVAESVPAIFLEKPMALNVSECEDMIKSVEKYGTNLCINHTQLGSPLIQRAKKLVDSNNFDLLCFSTIQKESYEILKTLGLAPAWNVSPEQGGILWEVCSHLAYLQLHFLPNIKEIYTVGGKNIYPVYDDFAVLLRTSGHEYGIIELSWLSHETETIYELRDLTGKRVQIHWEYSYFLENNIEPPYTVKNTLKNIFVDEIRLFKKWISFGRCYVEKGKIKPTYNLIKDYIFSIKNEQPPPVTPEDGKKTINLLECIKNSLNQNRPIKFNN